MIKPPFILKSKVFGLSTAINTSLILWYVKNGNKVNLSVPFITEGNMHEKNQLRFDHNINYRPIIYSLCLVFAIFAGLLLYDSFDSYYLERIDRIFNNPTIATKQDLDLILVPIFAYIYVGTLIFLGISVLKEPKSWRTDGFLGYYFGMGLIGGIVASLIVFALLLPITLTAHNTTIVWCLTAGFSFVFVIMALVMTFLGLKWEFE